MGNGCCRPTLIGLAPNREIVVERPVFVLKLLTKSCALEPADYIVWFNGYIDCGYFGGIIAKKLSFMDISNGLLFSWKDSYLTSVPKLVVTLSQSVVTTSVLLVRSGSSLMLQFTAAKGSINSSKSF